MTTLSRRLRWLLLSILAMTAFGQDFYTEPAAIAQGQALKVYSRVPIHKAHLNGRTAPLYKQAGGEYLGLLSIDVLARPGAYELEWLDDKGVPVHKSPIVIHDAHYAKQNVVLSKALSELHSTSDERELVTAFLKEELPERYWREPLDAPIHGCITSPFGVTRLHNGKPTGEYHAGLDQRGAMGTPIHPVTAGAVKIVQKLTLRGGTVAVDHGQGLESIYLHMSAFAVKEGDHVTPNDVIGYVGSTGRATGPHLHWTLYANGAPINPLQWITGLTNCSAAAPATPKRRQKPVGDIPG